MTGQWKVKPIATYKSGTLNQPAAVGVSVYLHCITHPARQLCGKHVHTSEITRVGNLGVFETLNTVYMPDRAWV